MSADTISKLLTASNFNNLRPLECAVNNGILGLAMAYLLTRDTYIIHEEDRGLATYQWIDVTEYEDCGENSRKEWSPLIFLTLLDKDRLNYPHTADFFTDPTILRWVRNKVRCGILPAIIYSLMRAILIILFIVLDSDISYFEENLAENNYRLTNDSICSNVSGIRVSLSPFMRNLLCCFLIFQTSIALSMDVAEYLTSFRPRHLCMLKRMDNKYKNIFLQYQGYRFAHSVTTLTICLRAIAALCGINDPRSDFVAYTRIVTRTFIWWSVTYLIQLMPAANFFVVAVQSMTDILMQFCLLYFLCLIFYTQLFMVAINFNMKHGCSAQFGDVPTAVYSSLLAVINMLDFTQLDLTNSHQLHAIHAIYVVMVQILLLNFLIAIMSDRITETSKRKTIILPMQELSVVLTMERQLKYCSQWYYKWIQRKLFTVYNGRLCIVRMVLNQSDGQSAINYNY